MNIRLYRYFLKYRNRSLLTLSVGFFFRFILFLVNITIVVIAKSKGAVIGSSSYIPLSLALKANKNLFVGVHTVIHSSNIDLRSPVHIGNYCIINKGVTILRQSHYIDSRTFETKYFDCLKIGDYAWLATSCNILPSVSQIANGSIVSAFSSLYKNTTEKSVSIGNPALDAKKRLNVHDLIYPESLSGRDFIVYCVVVKMILIEKLKK